MSRNTLRAIVVTAAVATAGAAWAGAEEGKALYDKQCKVCHSIGGEGGKMADKGGPLDGVGSKRDAAWLEAYLRDPKSKIEDAKMPKMKLTDEQIADLIAYMRTLTAAK
jgi:nitric oxide reductase subunit C